MYRRCGRPAEPRLLKISARLMTAHAQIMTIEDLRWAWLLTCRPWQQLPSAILSGKKRTARARCEWHNRSCWLQMAEQAADSPIIFSSYVENLEETAKVRYNEKLAMLGGAQDPYLTHQVPRRVC